jgi:ATP-binding cassette subfamily F protein uup
MDNVHEIKKVATSVKKSKSLEIDAKFSRLGSKICEFNKVSHSFGDLKILDKFDYVFKKGEKIGIVGGNGTGKSTFLKILTQELEPNTGTVDIGETIVLGHYKQEGLTFRPDFKVIDVLKEFAEIVELRDGKKISASQLLTQFHFDPKVQHNLVSKLSGGEKRRLYLLTILIQSPNFLILDEPTNDLDLDTLSTLEEYLMDFPGCLIIVSHDRSFLDRLSDHLFVFKGNAEIKDFPGTYTQYREKYKQEVKEKKKEVVVDKAPKEKVEKDNKKVSYKVQFEFDQTEKRMEELEAKKLELEAKVANESLETDALMEVSNEIGKIVDELDELFIRWSELSEEME